MPTTDTKTQPGKKSSPTTNGEGVKQQQRTKSHEKRPIEPQPEFFDYPSVPESEKKSVALTYILWLFGGIFGIHHLYLRRDRQAFIWWSTLGGYFGIGWLFDALKIPSLVRETNRDPQCMEEIRSKMARNEKPPFSVFRFMGSFLISTLWGQVVMMAVPDDAVNGINLMHLHWIIPLFVALGVWTVGNVGKERGDLWPCLAASYLSYFVLRMWLQLNDETYWFAGTAFVSALVFDSFSKQWRRRASPRKSKKKRVVPLFFAVIVYSALLCSAYYFNGKMTDDEGDEVPIHEAIQNMLNSPWWTDLQETWVNTKKFADHHGWGEVWKEVLAQLDVDGSMNAYKVLGLSATATQSEVTNRWRKLSRENHPDKVKDERLKKETQERFMEIQRAYEALSKVKNKRQQKNKKSNVEL